MEQPIIVNGAGHRERRQGPGRPLFGVAGSVAALALISCIGCADREESPSAAIRPQAETTGPARIDASLQAAEDYLNAGDLVNAEAILTRLIDRAPDDPRGYELLAHTQLSRGVSARADGNQGEARQHFERAYEHLTRVIELSPQVPGYHRSAGEIAQMLERNDAALMHYLRARELTPHDPKPALLAAQILIERSRIDEAEQALRDVLERDPDEPLAHVSLANLRLKQQRYDDALAAVREARDIDPAEISFRVLEATILRQAGRPEDALQLLVPLDDEQRARFSIAREIAACYAALDRPRDVARTWGFVYQSMPEAEHAWLAAAYAGEAMLDAGEVDMCRQWLHEARRLGDGKPEVDRLAGRIRDHAERAERIEP